MVKAVFADDFHINKRNFTSLYAYVAESKTELTVLESGKELMNLYADYSAVKSVQARRKTLEHFDADQLFRLTANCCGCTINVFEVARAEVLTMVLPNDSNWYDTEVPNDSKVIFDRLVKHNRRILLDCMAAVLVWCELYDNELDDLNKFNFAVVFSGSQIYQKIFSQIMMTKRPRLFITESFMTGNEFYWEERYTPIANNCDIRHDNIYDSIILEEEFLWKQNEITKAINKFRLAKNKNVTQPAESAPIIHFESDGKTLLLIAQVQNDFSIIESRMSNLNSLSVYKSLIEAILSRTDYNIVVKTHPHEKKKINMRSSFTHDQLSEFAADLSDDLQRRLVLVEDCNINRLMDQVNGLILLNSQAAFEACLWSGLRPITLGMPFYGGRGFTSDYTDIDVLVDGLVAGRVEFELDLSSYDKFLEFSTKLLQYQLANIHNSGKSIIRKKLDSAHKAVKLAGGDTSMSIEARRSPNIDEKEIMEGVEAISDTKELGWGNIYQLGLIAYHKQDFGRALSFFDETLKKNPDYVNALRCSAEILYRLGRQDEAIAYLEQAKGLLSNNKRLSRRLIVMKQPWKAMFLSDSQFEIPLPQDLEK